MGDPVTVDQVVVEVETAKASVEVPIPFAGTVETLHAAPGERVHVGSPLIISVGRAARRPTCSRPATAAAIQAAASAKSSEYSGNVLIGYGTSAAPARRQRRLRSHASPASPSARVEAGLKAEPAAPQAPAVISPVVRRLARERGIDLATVTASDPSGVIRRCDVEAVTALPHRGVAHRGADDSNHQPHPVDRSARGRRRTAGPLPSRDSGGDGLGRRRCDRTAGRAARPQRGRAGAPGQRAGAGGPVLRGRPEPVSRAEQPGRRPTRSSCWTRSTWVSPPRPSAGLMVPVAHGAQSMSTRQLSSRLSELTAGRSRRHAEPGPADRRHVHRQQLRGVRSGRLGRDHQPPRGGDARHRPDHRQAWVVDGQLAVRKVCQLTLAFDHRACDGGVAGGFLRFVADCVERPMTALGI